MQEITGKQKEVYEYIKLAVREKGYCPTVREICLAVGLTSPSSVHAHLNTLEHKGYIRRDPLKPRTIEIVEKASFQEHELIRIPVVGTVAAGQPLLADQNIDDYFSFPVDALHSRQSNEVVFMLRVKGDSMINAGIYHGDKIIVEQCDTAENGDIVVALVDDSATVKRFFKEDGYYRLQPENDTMQPIIVEHVEIQGKVIGLLRSF
ncbi:MAG: transcriptional repressor LexA [Enterocloster asparagiformis]|nr:transcriptional repressor LexA [Enterocloster asparagiformis]